LAWMLTAMPLKQGIVNKQVGDVGRELEECRVFVDSPKAPKSVAFVGGDKVQMMLRRSRKGNALVYLTRWGTSLRKLSKLHRVVICRTGSPVATSEIGSDQQRFEVQDRGSKGVK
jgi:hypothetical protein